MNNSLRTVENPVIHGLCTCDMRTGGGIRLVTGRIVVVKETAPAGNRGLTGSPEKEVAAVVNDTRRELALKHLTIAQTMANRAVRDLPRYVEWARRYGASQSEIDAARVLAEP